MARIQQGDVRHFQIFDGGEISVVDGVVEMNGGLETTAYLSLWGGNEDDNGRDGHNKTWWGNLSETQADRKYVSELQHLVQSLPLTIENLRRAEDAAKRDLAWMITSGAASRVDVTARIPALNTLELDIEIEALGEEINFVFSENWKAEQTRQVEIPPGVISTTQAYALLEGGDNILLESGDLVELEN